MARNGLKTIQSRHTCAHRTDELLEIYTAVARPKRVKKPRKKASEMIVPMLTPSFTPLN
jgi:spore maturation protein CgeB